MTSVNTPEEQAIAFLLTCVENSLKGKINWDNVSLDIGINMSPEAAAIIDGQQQEILLQHCEDAKEFDRSDKYPEIPGDPSWQSVTAEEIGPIIIVEDSNDTIT
ncbi:uncharacterized protein N7518_007892 [Penicillium psychrosexuale]|uniref:uncharacterized protein n=1 Tax=Penicillium psychrosexuale TaxID=1002107 RepID=UPI002544D789|nr:uncharacterized protein N7518_007892 [Penicillium psychrosexuale]KAJ5790881.1 hypothetical protein N7518_007892 [Penicillium psychrosexuale]